MRFVAGSGMGELHAQVAAVNRLFRLQDEFGTPPPHVITVEDVTRGIVIDPVDQQKIQRLILDTNATFEQKSQTVRLNHAVGRFIEVLRHSYKQLDSDTRMELTRRAMAFWKRNYQTDYSKPPIVRYEKSMRHTIHATLIKAVPDLMKAGGYKYISKKPDSRGGWVYEYPTYDGMFAHEREPLHHVSVALTPLHNPENKTHAKTPDHKAVKEALGPLVEKTKRSSPSSKRHVLASLRAHQKALRTHATNMTSYGHEHAGNARNVRDAVTDAIAAIVGKSEESKQKSQEKNARVYGWRKANELRSTAQRMSDHPMGAHYARNYKEHLEEYKTRFGAYPADHHPDWQPHKKIYTPSPASTELSRAATNASTDAFNQGTNEAHEKAARAHDEALDAHLVQGADNESGGAKWIEHHEKTAKAHRAFIKLPDSSTKKSMRVQDWGAYVRERRG
jgi:hypothetical protein